MQYRLVKLSTFLLFSLGLTTLQAQEAIPASSGNAIGPSGTASYTIGQVVYFTYSGTNGTVAQGVQQPFEISVLSSVLEGDGINLSYSVYPNPTSDFLTLKIAPSTSFSNQFTTYQLYDISGKLLMNNRIEGNETTIAMSNLSNGIYILKVFQKKFSTVPREIKTFKIIKN